MKTNSIFIIPLLIFVLFARCKKEDSQPELIAKTGVDTTASIGDTVWLDASASTGTDYSVEWTFHNQPGDDSITRSNTDSAFFIPLYNGAYQVKLTISKGNLFALDYQNVVVSGAVILEEDISARTRIKKIALPGEPDYIAIGEVVVSAQLIVDLGVIIEFRENASMLIKDGGEIYAEGASFIASDSTWKGICIKSKGNSFTGCLIHNAGNASFTEDPDDKAGIIMFSGSSLAFSGNTISNSGGNGLILMDGGSFFDDTENQVNAFHNNKFINNAEGPMVIPVQVFNYLNGQRFENETPGTFIEIYESTYPSSASIAPRLDDVGIPYKVTGILTFNKDMTINKGVEMYFEQDAGLRMNSSLIISGTSDLPVTMDGVSSTQGSWNGIYVNGGQANITYLNLLNAGGEMFSGLSEKASLTVENLLSMKNSTISGSGGIGLYMPGNGHIQYDVNFSDNTLENNAASAASLRMDDVTKVVHDNNIKSPDGTPAIEVRMGIDDALGTWANLDGDFDYKILESLTIKATKDLVIEAGVNIKMSAGTILTVSGGLQALGSAGSEITIEGGQGNKGYWDGIFVDSKDTIQLDRVLIRDAGGAFQDKANLIIQAEASEAAGTVLSVTNSTLNNSKGYGVIIKSGASDFSINDPVSNNTISGDLGDFLDENK